MRHHTSSTSSRSRPSSILSLSTLTSLLLAFPSLTSAAFGCKNIRAGGVDFNLEPLGGPRRLHWLDDDSIEGNQYNYTFTLDICKKLEWDAGTKKDMNCKIGTRVCALRETIHFDEDTNNTFTPIEIAGSFASDGRQLDERFELLRNSKSHADSEREGFRAELHGGNFAKIDNQAIIEFVCDRNRTGLEENEIDDGKKEPDSGDGDEGKDGDKEKDDKGQSLRRRGEDSACGDSNASLRFCKYGIDELEAGKKIRTLRLEWRTKYACEDTPAEPGESSSWGFFTWFIIILFLATASYLIFGSWLNYNRYGARGWDLLPHGDTIRDVPYILKDWARRVTSSIQGGGSRGGYSAV